MMEPAVVTGGREVLPALINPAGSLAALLEYGGFEVNDYQAQFGERDQLRFLRRRH
jgi:hypothetical protein